jgi:tetratricopeptide (TPR) repeat protein
VGRAQQNSPRVSSRFMRSAIPSLLLALSATTALVSAPDVTGTERLLLEQVNLHPTSFQANRALGEFYIQQHKLEAAIPCLERARETDSSNYENAYDLALAYLQTGKTAKSREVITGLLREKDRAELHNLLGDVEEADGHVQEAAQQYETAARMDPSEKNLFDLGSDLMLHRGFEPALKVFAFATERYPQSARLRVGLGIAYYSLGQYDDAVASLCQAVDLDPRDTKALDFLGKTYDISPRYAQEVTQRLAHFVQIYPDNAAAHYYYALSLRKRALVPGANPAQDEAEIHLLRAVKLNPAYADAHFELGLLYEDEKQDANAIQQYQLATSLRSDLSKAHYRLGRLYQKSGQSALAQKEFHAFETLQAK